MRRLQLLLFFLVLALSACSTSTITLKRAEIYTYDIRDLAKRAPVEFDLNADLAGRSSGGSGAGFDLQLELGSKVVQRQIMSAVKPSAGTWIDGPDTMTVRDGILTVSTTPSVHQAIEAWLARKRSEVAGMWIVE